MHLMVVISELSLVLNWFMIKLTDGMLTMYGKVLTNI